MVGLQTRPLGVLQTKLRAPTTRSDLIRRGLLVRRILAAPAPVVLIRAPAGYGKTTLMTQCAAETDQPLAWLALDRSDDEPCQLVRALASALQLGLYTDARRLVKDLAGAEPMLLLLDNVDALRNEASRGVLRMLCEHLPSGWKLVLSSRRTPELPLARMQASGLLTEIGPAELAMTSGEARRVLEAAHVPLESEAIERAHARSEGWPAGLYLASRAAVSADSPSRALREMGGEERDIVAYLSSEVLSQLSADQLGFVLQTSSLDRFCPSLCDALLRRRDSAVMIASLQQTCGFIVALDRRQTWFRFQHMFGESLRFILTQTNEAWLPELHARASMWFAAHDLPEEAIEHALASGNRRRASRLFAANVRKLFNGGAHAVLRRWIQVFSDADLAEYPPTAAAAAWVLGQFGERAPTRRFISILEHAESAGPFAFGERSNTSAVALLKAAFGWEGIAQMRALADTAYRIEPAGTEAHERAALYVGANLFLRGRFDAAQRFLEEATAAAETDANAAEFALGLLALVHLEAQQPAEARAALHAGFELMHARQLHGYTASAALFVACAYLDLERDDLDGARVCLERAVSLVPTASAVPWWSILLATWTGRIAIRLHDVQRAEWLLGQAQRELGRFPDSGMLAHWVQDQMRALEAAHGGGEWLREPLTEAELRVLELVPTHLTLEEIGQTLCISRNTVKTHLKVIYGKLSVSSRSAAVTRAQAVGLLRCPTRPVPFEVSKTVAAQAAL